MLKIFLTSTFRYLYRHKGFSFINIAGLTISLTACVLIGLFVWDEYSYDRFIPDAKQVYRIYDVKTNHDGTSKLAVGSPMFAATMLQDFSEVKSMTRVMMLLHTRRLLEAGSKKIYEQSGLYVDSTFFEVFPLRFKYGSEIHALDETSSIVISTEMAQRYFGSQNPVGEQVIIDKVPFRVTGVVQVNPKFHLQFNYLANVASLHIPVEQMTSWDWNYFYNYVKLNKNINLNSLQLEFQKDVVEKSRFAENNEGSTDEPFLQPLTDIHLYDSDFKSDVPNRGNVIYINALMIVAIFILLTACFNFINLATAKSLQRAREVGIRKSVGAGRRQLIFQFLGEPVFLFIISIVASITLSIMLLPWLNSFTGKHISFSLLINPILISSLLALAVVVGIIAGFYPAIILSGFKPVKVLKETISKDAEPGKVSWMRHGLVITQFSLSVLLIVSAIVVYNQVHYLHNKSLGFNKEQLMFFPIHSDSMFAHVDAFKNNLLEIPGVSNVSIGYGFPGDAVAADNIIVPRNGLKISESATQLAVDYDYIKTLRIKLVAGRDFSKGNKVDADHAFIINETAVKQLGFGTPQQAIGKDLAWHPWNTIAPDSLKTGKIIGVVKDFNYASLYNKVETTVLQIYPDAAWQVAVKLKGPNISQTVNAISKIWNQFSPNYPLEYKFLDENFTNMYGGEDKLKQMLFIFTAIAVFIGCLGLFGLSVYFAERRKKEIGIRKILGSNIQNLVFILSKEIIQLVVVSIVLASPIAWFIMNRWLQNFAYRITLSWQAFAIAAIISLGIALITISFESIKAALQSPINNLRT